jgi:hypothetical protein
MPGAPGRRCPGIICYCPAFCCSRPRPPTLSSKILRLCYMNDAPVSVDAGILTPRTSTTGAARSARFARTARVGGLASGRSCASSRG